MCECCCAVAFLRALATPALLTSRAKQNMRRSPGGVAVLLLLDSARCAPVPESIWAAARGCAALKETKYSLDVATAGMVVGDVCDTDERCSATTHNRCLSSRTT